MRFPQNEKGEFYTDKPDSIPKELKGEVKILGAEKKEEKKPSPKKK